MIIFVILALVFAIIAVIFALQNAVVITVTFFFWKFDSTLALVLLVTLLAGVVISLLVSLPGLMRNIWSLRGLRKRLVTLDDERRRFEQRAEEAEKEVKVLEDQVANLSAEYDKAHTAEESQEPPQPPESPAV